MPGVGNTQTIGGQNYQLYSPAWYEAQRGDKITNGATAGKAAGAGVNGFLSELPPSLMGLADTSSTSASSSGSSSGSSAARPTVSMPASVAGLGGGSVAGAPPASVDHIAPVDYTAANSAAFATAKDQAAQTARASLTALSGELSARGMGGAGYEGGQIGDRVATAANSIGAASRAEAEHEADLSSHAASENYQGDIVQRGQDIGAGESAANRAASMASTAFQGGIAQRGQDIGEDESNRSMNFNETSRNQDALFKLLSLATNGIRGAY